MRAKELTRYALSATLLFVGGCSLIVDVSDIDLRCRDDQKVCMGQCVDQTDPAYGCGKTGCLPCALMSAVPKCVENECQVDDCIFPFGCPDTMGCRTNLLVDAANCGECAHACDGACQDGLCTPDSAERK